MPLIGTLYGFLRGKQKHASGAQTYQQAKAYGFMDDATLIAFKAKVERRKREIQAVKTSYYINKFLTPNMLNLTQQQFSTARMPGATSGPGVRFTVDRRWKDTLSEYARFSGKTLAAATVRRASGILREMWFEGGKSPAIQTEQQERAAKKQAILRRKVKFPKRGPKYTLAAHILLRRAGGTPMASDIPDGWARRMVPKKIKFKSKGPDHHARLKLAASEAIENAGKINRKSAAFFRVSTAGAMEEAIQRAKRKFSIPQDQLQSKPITFWKSKKKVFKPGGKIGFGRASGERFQPQLKMAINGAIAQKYGENILRKAINKDIEDMDKFIERQARKKGFL